MKRGNNETGLPMQVPPARIEPNVPRAQPSDSKSHCKTVSNALPLSSASARFGKDSLDIVYWHYYHYSYEHNYEDYYKDG
jgi:hypothetical protein